jgi:hypothetical protein
MLVESASTETPAIVLTSRTYATAILIVLLSSALSFASSADMANTLDLIESSKPENNKPESSPPSKPATPRQGLERRRAWASSSHIMGGALLVAIIAAVAQTDPRETIPPLARPRSGVLEEGKTHPPSLRGFPPVAGFLNRVELGRAPRLKLAKHSLATVTQPSFS